MANAVLFMGWNRPHIGMEDKAFGWLTSEGLAMLRKSEGKAFERLVRVELELPRVRGEGDGVVVPITRKATRLTSSGITGFTLPGMIEEPGCNAGRLISARPRGPDVSRIRSLAIFDSLMARLLSAEE